ncbi:MAG TPA: hypothetical protein VE596_14305 [Gaiellaceae bacterium]|jgi:hypothetical protein|nr:hypothetical protein [Gaiellaceae bacterium]
MTDEERGNADEIEEQVRSGAIQLGNGARFWAYISPSNNTAACLSSWSVTVSQGDWSGTIMSNDPQQQLQTPDLSGVFDVKVEAAGQDFPEQQLTPTSYSKPNIGCNSNCAAMIGIVANPDCTDANYWTTWDAVCKPS